MKTLLSLIACLFLQGCFDTTTGLNVVTKIENVQQVFMHEPGRYSVLIGDNKQSTVQRLGDYLAATKTVFLYDVPADKNPWVEILVTEVLDERALRQEITFHLKPAQKLQGAGWDHGKGGHGQTIPIKIN